MHDLFLFISGRKGFIIFPHFFILLLLYHIFIFWLVSYSSGREFGWIFIAFSSRKFIGEGFFCRCLLSNLFCALLIIVFCILRQRLPPSQQHLSLFYSCICWKKAGGEVKTVAPLV